MHKALFALFFFTPTLALAAGHSSGMGWFGSQVISSLIHGVVYGLIFKLFNGMGLLPALLLGGALLFGAWWYYQKNR